MAALSCGNDIKKDCIRIIFGFTECLALPSFLSGHIATGKVFFKLETLAIVARGQAMSSS